MDRWYKVSDEEKVIAYNQLARKAQLPAFAIEKDWWVVQALNMLFEMEVANDLIFKGGTSLSKGWGLIERFSEDIDLAINRKFFGFGEDLGKNQRDKLRKTFNKYIREVLFPSLTLKLKENHLNEVALELQEIKSSDQDPLIISLHYPSVTAPNLYLRPKVQIEISCRSLMEPYEHREIVSLLDANYPNSSFSQKPIKIPVASPEKTFLEKLFLLHEEFQKPLEKIRVKRLSRHLYDIHQLSKSEFANKAIENHQLYETIVKHRHRYTKIRGVDYNLHQPQTINPVPPESILSKWSTDYSEMQEQMIYGDSLSFEDLIEEIEKLKDRINRLEWTIEEIFK